jgi:hypothetical protein
MVPKLIRRVGRYELTARILAGDAKRGIPELWRANSFGDMHYARVWRRSSPNDFELRALWNREVRSLTRLHGYPGAANFFVRLYDLGVADDAYYAILSGGQYVLLREVLAARHRYAWLQNLSELTRRRPVWEGLLRIAEALTILHGEGTLHRSLSPSSIFCGPSGQGDFRLSGFEWSLRIAGSDTVPAKITQRNSIQASEIDQRQGEYSTATDWFDFGVVVAELFGAPVANTKSRSVIRDAISGHGYLRERERVLILGLLDEDPEQRVTGGHGVTQAIRDIIRDLGVVTAAANRPLVLAVRASVGNSLSAAIEKASAGAAPATDAIAQRDWIQNDLRGDLRVIGRQGNQPHFLLRGSQFSYRVRPWTANGFSTWEVGYCEQVEAVPTSYPDDEILGMGVRRVEVVLYPYARKHLQSLRDRAAAWDRILPFRSRPSQLSSDLQDTLDFFRVTQQIETLLTVAQICPMRVVEFDPGSTDTYMTVTPEDEPARNELAQHLMLGPPSEQLRDLLGLGAEAVTYDDEDQPSDVKWSFLERRTVANEPRSPQVWRFVRAEPNKDGPRYTFKTDGSAAQPAPKLYLARDFGGAIRQIRRRHKAIEDLRSHEGLLRLLSDPFGASHRTEDTVPPGRRSIPLDDSKLGALEGVWRSTPSFALQGPPGSGKTTLIQAFADRLLTDDASAQLLVTAHSHHTVDDVLAKLVKLFSDEKDHAPIILRLGTEDGHPQSAGAITSSILHGMIDSDLVAAAPAYLRSRLSAVVEQASQNDRVALERRTLQYLVQDAANITCATSNNGELADLATRGRRFDWSIIEESAKAHGFDMAVALQESHRLLLIGDHKQLPPFNSKKFKDVLGDVLRVSKAIEIGAEFAPALVDDSILETEEGRASLEERCDYWRRMVTFFEQFFELSTSADPTRPGPAATLTDQHRMHPHIATLVGNVFYPDASGGTIIRSPEETHQRFKSAPPFTLASLGPLPEHRIVWWDVPWIQKEVYAEGEAEGLFIADAEVRAVLKILENIRSRDGCPCELQILSPYNDQLKAVRRALDSARESAAIKHMFEPPFSIQEQKRMGATVDEFQGSEADVVIVTLVRNNALVPWKSVGFLKEASRLNVLLSRARHKLVIVGSWDFFSSRCNENTALDAEYAFLGQMMSEMQKARKDGRLSRVRTFA